MKALYYNRYQIKILVLKDNDTLLLMNLKYGIPESRDREGVWNFQKFTNPKSYPLIKSFWWVVEKYVSEMQIFLFVVWLMVPDILTSETQKSWKFP